MIKRAAKIGYWTGAVYGVVTLGVLLAPGSEDFHSRGPATPGHEEVECVACHTPAAGTLGQQIQANLQYVVGRRKAPVTFGHEDPDNNDCLECHERPSDNHPVFRFEEPRFADVRAVLAVQNCITCHREHRGVRVSMPEVTFCRHCHDEFELKRDPLDVSHRDLAERQDWESCLGCHDFHGNHVRETQTRLADGISLERVLDYFRDGPTPYSERKQYEARK